MRGLIVIFLLILSCAIGNIDCYGQNSPFITISHEEDSYGCVLESVDVPSQNLTSFINDNYAIVMAQQKSQGKEIELARVNFVYNNDGFYIGVFIDNSVAPGPPMGFIIDDSSFIKGNLFLSVAFANDRKTFLFHSPEQDTRPPPSFIDLKTEALIPFMLKKIKALEDKNRLEKYSFVKKEATDFMDFRQHFGGFTLINGVLYNKSDAGNYVWGMEMQKLGFTYLEVKVGSELNGMLYTRKQNSQGHGIILTGDSDLDQKAIEKGFDNAKNIADGIVNCQQFLKTSPHYLTILLNNFCHLNDFTDQILLEIIHAKNTSAKTLQGLVHHLLYRRSNTIDPLILLREILSREKLSASISMITKAIFDPNCALIGFHKTELVKFLLNSSKLGEDDLIALREEITKNPNLLDDSKNLLKIIAKKIKEKASTK